MDESIFNRFLADVVEALYENAPGFRRRVDGAGLTPAGLLTVADLSKLPILRKDDLLTLQKEDPPFGGLLAIPISELRRVFQSPGPLYEPEPDRVDPGTWAPALHAAGFDEGDLVLNAFGYHLTPAGASLEQGLRALNCVVLPGGVGNQEQQIQAIATLGITGYVGLPSYLKALLDKAQALGLQLPLRKAFVLAEPLPPSLRQELRGRGVTVYQGYGTAECGNLGYECEQLAGWHIPHGVLVQICDINSGEPLPHGRAGEVVVTLLGGHYALVRFGVGDLSSIIAEPCPCGRPELRLNGWQGRVGMATKVRGMFLHPRQLADLFQRFPEVAAYQAVVTRDQHRDELVLQVVLKEAVPAGWVETVQQTARELIKFRPEIDIVSQLPANASPIRDERTWD